MTLDKYLNLKQLKLNITWHNSNTRYKGMKTFEINYLHFFYGFCVINKVSHLTKPKMKKKRMRAKLYWILELKEVFPLSSYSTEAMWQLDKRDIYGQN